jgi:hypothetical protein
MIMAILVLLFRSNRHSRQGENPGMAQDERGSALPRTTREMSDAEFSRVAELSSTCYDGQPKWKRKHRSVGAIDQITRADRTAIN